MRRDGDLRLEQSTLAASVALIVLIVLSGAALAETADSLLKPERLSPRLRVDHSMSVPSPFRLTIERSDYRVNGVPTGTPVVKPLPGNGLSPMIERHAKAQRLDPALVHAVIRAESAYRTDAVSPKGAVGLMQVMPATGKRFGVSDLEHPESNLKAGTIYLRYLLDRFDNVPLALAAYNAGEGAVSRSGNTIPPYPETRGYVQEVLQSYVKTLSPASPSSRVYADGVRFADSNSLDPYRLIDSAYR